MSARITTHVLDTATGRPARGMALSLARLGPAGFIPVAQAVTNDDGRAPGLTDGTHVGPGTWRVRFETGSWFEASRIEGFYPYAEVVFTLREADAHVHVPLLLSPFGYSTYRGS